MVDLPPAPAVLGHLRRASTHKLRRRHFSTASAMVCCQRGLALPCADPLPPVFRQRSPQAVDPSSMLGHYGRESRWRICQPFVLVSQLVSWSITIFTVGQRGDLHSLRLSHQPAAVLPLPTSIIITEFGTFAGGSPRPDANTSPYQNNPRSANR